MTKRNKKEEQKQEETRKLEKAREALRASGNGAMILYGEYLTESRYFPFLQTVAEIDNGSKITIDDLEKIYLAAFAYSKQAQPVIDYIHTRMASDIIPRDSEDFLSEYIDRISKIMQSFDDNGFKRDFLKIGTLTYELLTDPEANDFYTKWENNYQKAVEFQGELSPHEISLLNPHQKENLKLLQSPIFTKILHKIEPELSIKILYNIKKEFVAAFKSFPQSHIVINANQMLCLDAERIFSTLIHESCHHEQHKKQDFNNKFYLWAKMFYTRYNSFAYLGNPMEMQAYCRSAIFSYLMTEYKNNPEGLQERLDTFKQKVKIVPEKQEKSMSLLQMIKEQATKTR